MPSLRAVFLVVTLFSLALLTAACERIAGVDFGSVHLKTENPAALDGGATSTVLLDCSKGCTDYGFECGTQYDACGVARECGACPDGRACQAGKCACVPKSCTELGAQCGTIADGCGGVLDCGTCANPNDGCTDNKCTCRGKTCKDQGYACGNVPDGCGQEYACGSCTDGANPNCGGGGPGKCGPNPCVPKTCGDLGKNCGSVNDGCGNIIPCGGCTAPQTCGGGGVANVCGCTTISCAAQGKICGSTSDGCGGTLDCGTCPSSYSCSADQKTCTCVSNGSCDECCGTGMDNCGNACTRRTCCTGGCFGAGTPVRMADGTYKPIEQVEPGERVASYDRRTGLMHAALVLARLTHGPETSAEGFLLRRTPAGLLRVTPNHPILVNGRRARADSIHAGSRVFTPEFQNTPVSLATDMIDLGVRTETIAAELDRTPGNGEPTYDLKVDGPGTFFAANTLVLQKVEP